MTEGFDLIFDKHEINQVSIEDMFYAFNPKTVIKLAQFRGAISLKILQKFEQRKINFSSKFCCILCS